MDSDLTAAIQKLATQASLSMSEFASVLPTAARSAVGTPTFLAGLASYLAALDQTNQTMNLTADADPTHLLATHVRDSLAPLLVGLQAPHALLDIGTGGGFPAVPLALAWPDTSVTMTESIGKKARFLESLVVSVPLPKAHVVHGRAEDPSTGLPERTFDMITARGVAHVATVLQYALPLLADHGMVVLWKGERDLVELEDPPFVAVLHRLHCEATVFGYNLPGVERNSKLIILQVTPVPHARSPRRNGL
ncbi:MAG: 16S rRNA (guanine(527)-N(7))-methyltransferase RsmG [Candidatus Cryosericum sp.]